MYTWTSSPKYTGTDKQHDDLVSFGKLIMTLCCEWFVPGQHPAAPLDHISRHYSPDVKNLVMYLCGKPPSGKNIDEVISILGLRILNEFDAMQKWVWRGSLLIATWDSQVEMIWRYSYNDMLESELSGEVENGRLVRLMTKLGFINERAE
jgi:PAB-dependent poly(A)-specific ribonuclease subunit 3